MRDVNFVVTGWLFEKPGTVKNAAALGIGRGKDKTRDAGKRNRRCAHRTGFQRNIQIVTGNALRAFRAANIADYKNFGMAGGIVQFPRAIAVTGDDLAARAVDQNGANRHFVAQPGGTGLFHCGLHIDMVILHRG